MDFKSVLSNKTLLHKVAYILVLIGGINWGLVGLLGLDIVTSILGGLLGRLIFIIVGVAAGYLIYEMFAGKKQSTPQQPGSTGL